VIKSSAFLYPSSLALFKSVVPEILSPDKIFETPLSAKASPYFGSSSIALSKSGIAFL